MTCEAAYVLEQLKKLENDGVDICAVLVDDFSTASSLLNSIPSILNTEVESRTPTTLSLRITDGTTRCYSYRSVDGYWHPMESIKNEASVCIDAPSSTWMAVVTGSISPASALESGRMQIRFNSPSN